MRTLVIGDIHGHSGWQDIIKKEKYDKVVFLGDYFDNFAGTSTEEQVKNFQEILDFQKIMGDNCILLYGNHDHSYYNLEKCSGYHYQNQKAYETILEEAIKNNGLRLVYIDGDILYSHAGVSKYWLEEVAFLNDVKDITFDNIDLNSLNWNMFKGYSPYGDTISNSPIWIRPNALNSNMIEGYRQIIGHTHLKKPFIDERMPDIYINDLLPNYYIIVEDGKINYVKNELQEENNS